MAHAEGECGPRRAGRDSTCACRYRCCVSGRHPSSTRHLVDPKGAPGSGLRIAPGHGGRAARGLRRRSRKSDDSRHPPIAVLKDRKMGRFHVRQTLSERKTARKPRRGGFPTGRPFSFRLLMCTGRSVRLLRPVKPVLAWATRLRRPASGRCQTNGWSTPRSTAVGAPCSPNGGVLAYAQSGYCG